MVVFEIKIMVKSNAMFILDISQTRQQARLSNAKVVRALITVVFQPTLNTIMRAWVYMTFFIIQMYSNVPKKSACTFISSKVCLLCSVKVCWIKCACTFIRHIRVLPCITFHMKLHSSFRYIM